MEADSKPVDDYSQSFGEEVERGKDRKRNPSPARQRHTTQRNLESSMVNRMAQYAKDRYATLALSEPPKTLAKDGVWLVGPRDRPKGWRTMGLKEPEAEKGI